MNHRSLFTFLTSVCLSVSLALATQVKLEPVAAAGVSRARAIATVRATLQKNSSSCRIDRVQSIAAVRSGTVWKVTARLVMSASGRAVKETAIWNVRVSDGGAVAASQLSAEIENGCPW